MIVLRSRTLESWPLLNHAQVRDGVIYLLPGPVEGGIGPPPVAGQLCNGCIPVGPPRGQLAIRETDLHHNFP